MTDPIEIGRVAIRTEGDVIVARWAPQQDTMEGAILLGSVGLAHCQRDPRIFDSFMAFARLIVSVAIVHELGAEPSWSEPAPAPEHERAGRS